MQIYNLSYRFIIGSALLLLFFAPVLGWSMAAIYKQVEVQSSNISGEDAEKLINKYLIESQNESPKQVKFVSLKKFQKNWYVVTVKDSGITYKSVLVDFKKPQVILGPGLLPPEINISHMGIPYEIIDEIILQGQD